MPELPEVENIIRQLQKEITGYQISSVDIRLPKIIRNSRKTFLQALLKASINDVRRRGKLLIFELSSGYCLLIHLKISGQLFLVNKAEPADKHTHIVIGFKGRKAQLRYRDVRQFGYMKVVAVKALGKILNDELGKDYLEVSYDEFKEAISGRKKNIKSFLLDQKIFAGLGNIYACEALYQAGIHPKSNTAGLKARKIKRLFFAIEDILREAIRLGGSSVDDYYMPDKSTGSYQEVHKVYKRENEPCPICKTPISRKKTASRSTYFCPRCQKIAS